MSKEVNNMEPTTQTPQKGKMNPLMIVGVLAIVAIAAYLLMPKGDTNTDSAPTVSSPAGTVEENTVPPDDTLMGEETTEGSVRTITMEAGSFYYSVPEIRVKQGDTVRIEMTSVDMMHDFTIDELGVKSPIVESGDSTTIEFVAGEAGEFEYYCSVGEHRANGQVGTLIVE